MLFFLVYGSVYIRTYIHTYIHTCVYCTCTCVECYYRKSENFRVQKFPCKKFSSKKIFGCERLSEIKNTDNFWTGNFRVLNFRIFGGIRKYFYTENFQIYGSLFCLWLHAYIHTYIHTCTYIHTYIHTYMYIHTYIHTCTYIHTYMYMCRMLLRHFNEMVVKSKSRPQRCCDNCQRRWASLTLQNLLCTCTVQYNTVHSPCCFPGP